MSFFPKIIKFFELFREQNDILLDSVNILDELFTNHTNIPEKCSKIVKNEYSGNDISKEIAKQLFLTFITPIDREDIHAINMAQENLLNSMRAISARIGFYNFPEIAPGARELIQKLNLMIVSISHMLDYLHKKKDVSELSSALKETKFEADMLLLLSLGETYERPNENTRDLLEIIKWSHIYDRIEEAFANAEVLANVIEGVALKNA